MKKKHIIIVFLIQYIATLNTNTKKLSVQAFMRNIGWYYSLNRFILTKNILWLLLPIISNCLLNIFIYLFYNNSKLEPYLTTQYLYNDYFEAFVHKDPALQYYTEGDYSKLLDINTLDLSNKNTNKIMKWGKQQYKNSFDNKDVVDFNNKKIDLSKLMIDSQNNKYKWIVDNLEITKDSRVLELGFGRLDLMLYIRKNTGATVEGTNISIEQIKNARKNNFKVYNIDFNKLKYNLKKLGTYDILITNGSLEYLKNNNNHNVYYEFIKVINKLLKPKGKWYTTTIHYIPGLCLSNNFSDYYNFYNLGIGNEGGYPKGINGLTKFNSIESFVTSMEKKNLKVKKQENRWLDYYIYSIIWMIIHNNKIKNDKSYFKHMINYIAAPNYLESYLCYTPVRNINYQPWVWQFSKKEDGCVPTQHQWIIFEKN